MHLHTAFISISNFEWIDCTDINYFPFAMCDTLTQRLLNNLGADEVMVSETATDAVGS